MHKVTRRMETPVKRYDKSAQEMNPTTIYKSTHKMETEREVR